MAGTERESAVDDAVYVPPPLPDGGFMPSRQTDPTFVSRADTVENPLAALDGQALVRDVEQFATAIGFDGRHLQELQRGAFIAKYVDIAEAVADGRISAEAATIRLSEEEKIAIQSEKRTLLKQSRDMYITTITCAMAALVQGWDQTGLNGANLFWPKIFGLQTDTAGPIQSGDDWIVGLVNAAPYLAASMIGCLLVDPLNNSFGRRGTIFFAGLWCFASVIGSAFTHTWQALFISRLCLGIGMGAKASTVPIFAAESAPAYFRGSIVMSWQLWVASGILLGFSANLMVSNLQPNIAWRLMVGSALLPAIPLLILVYIAPESPRWYMKKGTAESYRKAFAAFRRLRNTDIQAYRDFYFAYKQLQLERRDYMGKLWTSDALVEGPLGPRSRPSVSFARFCGLFSQPRIRRATLASCTVMLAQQLCGINVLAFYSSTLFAHFQSNVHTNVRTTVQPHVHPNDGKIRAVLLYSWGFGLVNTLFALPAVKTIDRFGRRPLLLFSVANMAWTMLAAGLSSLIPNDHARTGVIAFFLFLFAAFYSPGQGPVPFTYSAESYPLSHREAGMGLSVAVNLFFAGVLTVTFPRLRTALHNSGALSLFAGLNIVALVMIFFWVPETAQRTLEELSYVFGKRTRDYMHYQVFEVVPHYFSRYALFRQPRRPLRDFYKAPYHPDETHSLDNILTARVENPSGSLSGDPDLGPRGRRSSAAAGSFGDAETSGRISEDSAHA